MRKIFFLPTFIILYIFSVNAQQKGNDTIAYGTCGTTAPNAKWEAWFSKKINEFEIKKNLNRNSTITYTIPVIIHILHNGDAPGQNENISWEQANSQFKILNDDYAGRNSDIDLIPQVFLAVKAGNTGIQFCPATQSPNGTALAEIGIERINWQTQNWTNLRDPRSFTDIHTLEAYFNNTIKPNTYWDPSRYLNIWVADISPTLVLGYAMFPKGSGLSDINPNDPGVETELTSGVVMNQMAWGNIGTALYPYDKGRTAVHEIGHYLGVHHTFQGGCIGSNPLTCNSSGDYCCDTPPTNNSKGNLGCPPTQNTCTEFPTDRIDMIMNYMDNTSDRCRYMFTADQAMRMQTTMANGIYRSTLASSPGCNSICADRFEPNNAYTSSTLFFGIPFSFPIVNSVDNDINANIGYQGDVDWFKVTLASCGNLSITLSNLPYNYDIELYGPNGSTQAAITGSYNTGIQNETINFQSTSDATTTYYIKIYSATPSNFSNASCYNLRMQWASSTCVVCTAPAITTHPTNKSVTAPNGTSFSIAVSGSDNSYQWQLNMGNGWSNILNSTSYSGAYTTTLNISSTSLNMSGYQYRCKVSSSCTSTPATSNAATLTVNTSSTSCNNDYACSPRNLAISSSCVVTNCSTIGASTTTSDGGYKSCSNVAYQASRYDDDVWFSITPANTNPVTIKVTATSNLSFFDPVLGIYINGCLSMVQINGGCSDNPIGVPEQITFTPVAGTTYLLRVFSYGMGGTYSGNFDICVTAAGQPNPVADLIIANSQLSVNSLCAGDAVNVSYTIQNIGGLSAAASTVKYYLSSDNSYSASDVLLGSTSVNGINSNASASYNRTLIIPTGTSVGSWYVLVIADANGDISEGSSGEVNNVFANSIQINNCSGLADLVINYNSFTPATITPGTSVQVNYTMQNLGTLLASPIHIGIYISTDNNFDFNNDEFLYDWVKGSLNPGQTVSDLLYLTVPNCYQCGTAYIFLVIDYQNIINETNNSNNTSSFPIQVSGCAPCTYTVPSTGINFQSSGGSGNLNITTTQCCPWTATTNDNWITIINSSGNGSGAVNYTVGACTGDGTRTGTITVAGKSHTITQNCIENCNTSQSFQWAAKAGSSTLSDAAEDVAIDLSGNLYMTGDIQGSANFGNGIILTTPSTAPDVFVSKHNSAGQIQWAVQYGNTSQEGGSAIVTDNNGNIYVVGNFMSTITFNNIILNATNNAAFLLKLNSSGVVQWAVKINDYTNANDIVIDINNNLYVTGGYSSAGGGLFVAKYNTGGTQIWYNTYGSSSYCNAFGITADNSGNIFICGNYMTNISLGTFTLNAIYGTLDTDGFIVKMNPNGNIIWAKKMTSPGQGRDEFRSVAVDAANNIYTLGHVDSTAIIENIIIPLPDLSSKLIIIKYDPNGNPLWAKASTSGFQYNKSAIVKGNDDNMYICGDFYKSMKIDSFSIVGAGDNDAFLSCIDENGKVKWLKEFGGILSESARGIITNSSNELFVAGGFYGTVPFGNQILTSFGSEDIYLAKFRQCDLPTATITYNGNLIVCPGQSLDLATGYCSKNNYQWLLNDIEIPSANYPTYAARQSGVYKVKVAAFPGCETISNPITINSQGLYTFTGTGNWNVASNWANNAMPPSPLPSCYEIIINPIGNTECILNVPQTISPGAKVTVVNGKRFKILGNLIIMQ